jgi:hypothetical protein
MCGAVFAMAPRLFDCGIVCNPLLLSVSGIGEVERSQLLGHDVDSAIVSDDVKLVAIFQPKWRKRWKVDQLPILVRRLPGWDQSWAKA